MVYLQLLIEFLMIGTFAVGGGLATLPFLYDLTTRYTWFDKKTLVDMIAISESTPGPIGINMATFAGYKAGGVLGGVIASLAVIAVGVTFMLIIARILQKFKNHPIVKRIFYGIRPTIAAFIVYAGWEVIKVTLINIEGKFQLFPISIALYVLVLVLLFKTKISPILLILAAAFVGIIIPI
jgi:chromate transporter